MNVPDKRSKQAIQAAIGKTLPDIIPQEDALDNTTVWVLPNPSGLNAHYQLEGLARSYRELWIATQSQ
jgi:TDG/mug DNA glycosylase family protein